MLDWQIHLNVSTTKNFNQPKYQQFFSCAFLPSYTKVFYVIPTCTYRPKSFFGDYPASNHNINTHILFIFLVSLHSRSEWLTFSIGSAEVNVLLYSSLTNYGKLTYFAQKIRYHAIYRHYRQTMPNNYDTRNICVTGLLRKLFQIQNHRCKKQTANAVNDKHILKIY